MCNCLLGNMVAKEGFVALSLVVIRLLVQRCGAFLFFFHFAAEAIFHLLDSRSVQFSFFTYYFGSCVFTVRIVFKKVGILYISI